MTTAPNQPNQDQGLSPEGLTNRLFDMALAASATKDPTEISQQVIDFLGGSLVYALTSAKRDIIVFLTETLLMVVSANNPDPTSRAGMFKKIGETFANAAAQAAQAAQATQATQATQAAQATQATPPTAAATPLEPLKP